jgi:O-acetyl-ADP-ribose deacetylase (regulator of RNase III)
MKVIKGDLIKLAKQQKFNVICHGSNCFCTFGAGIAKQIKQEFPEAYEADLKTNKGDKSKLGWYSKAYNY